MNQEANTDHAPPTHQIVADGVVIYTGEEWQEAFLEASKNPEYGEIVHISPDGAPGAQWGAPVYKAEQE